MSGYGYRAYGGMRRARQKFFLVNPLRLAPSCMKARSDSQTARCPDMRDLDAWLLSGSVVIFVWIELLSELRCKFGQCRSVKESIKVLLSMDRNTLAGLLFHAAIAVAAAGEFVVIIR